MGFKSNFHRSPFIDKFYVTDWLTDIRGAVAIRLVQRNRDGILFLHNIRFILKSDERGP